MAPTLQYPTEQAREGGEGGGEGGRGGGVEGEELEEREGGTFQTAVRRRPCRKAAPNRHPHGGQLPYDPSFPPSLTAATAPTDFDDEGEQGGEEPNEGEEEAGDVLRAGNDGQGREGRWRGGRGGGRGSPEAEEVRFHDLEGGLKDL